MCLTHLRSPAIHLSHCTQHTPASLCCFTHIVLPPWLRSVPPGARHTQTRANPPLPSFDRQRTAAGSCMRFPPPFTGSAASCTAQLAGHLSSLCKLQQTAIAPTSTSIPHLGHITLRPAPHMLQRRAPFLLRTGASPGCSQRRAPFLLHTGASPGYSQVQQPAISSLERTVAPSQPPELHKASPQIFFQMLLLPLPSSPGGRNKICLNGMVHKNFVKGQHPT
ncbi:hypothetical protein Taro_003682 [Colocasia esculenta]|uniref:Uncharacterized protein n=1 Tax=Colocasia esculenta TaxID=4460 RepID=A0A843TKG1_COLES|nr:hypothetical protein [Colocasia esculenta]